MKKLIITTIIIRAILCAHVRIERRAKGAFVFFFFLSKVQKKTPHEFLLEYVYFLCTMDYVTMHLYLTSLDHFLQQ